MYETTFVSGFIELYDTEAVRQNDLVKIDINKVSVSVH